MVVPRIGIVIPRIRIGIGIVGPGIGTRIPNMPRRKHALTDGRNTSFTDST